MYRVHLVTPCSGGYGVACSPDGWVPATYAVDLCLGELLNSAHGYLVVEGYI